MREEDALAERNGSVSLEEDISEAMPNEGPTSGEEIFAEQVRATRFFADVLPSDSNRTPEAEFDGREIDDEDLNGNTRLDQDNGYFTTTIDLKETEALVDVVYDYDDVQ